MKYGRVGAAVMAGLVGAMSAFAEGDVKSPMAGVYAAGKGACGMKIIRSSESVVEEIPVSGPEGRAAVHRSCEYDEATILKCGGAGGDPRICVSEGGNVLIVLRDAVSFQAIDLRSDSVSTYELVH